MFKQKENNIIEEKDKNAGFVDENGNNLSTKPVEVKEEPNPNDVDLTKKVDIKDLNLKKIEDERAKFLKVVKKQNIIKWTVSFVSIGLLVFAWLFFLAGDRFKDNPGMRFGFGLGLTGVSIAMIIAYYLVTKKFNDKKMSEYLKVYYGCVNSYVYGDEKFAEVHGDISGKLDINDFNNSRAFKNVTTLNSRNVVNFNVNQTIKCKVCDCAAQQSTIKKLVPVFIGKYIVSDNTYKGDEDIIIYLTGNSRALPPNNVETMPKVLNTKKMIIYTNYKNYESVVNAKVRQLLAQIITNNVLVDCFISITKGKTYIGLGYDDCLMVVPLQNQFNPIPTDCYKKDMQIIADIITNLNK